MQPKLFLSHDRKARLKAAANDKLYRFFLADGSVRGAVLNGWLMVNDMRAAHDLGILETTVLGRAFLATGLMSGSLKGSERIVVQIDCSGPIKGLVAECNAFGEVRGYLKAVPITVDKPLRDFNLSPFFGAGILSVTRYLRDAKQPFTGQVILQYGNIAQDLAFYYLTSEQIPSAFNLSIHFDPEGRVTGAGGLFLQAMHDAEETVIKRLEKRVPEMPSISLALSRGATPQEIVTEAFAEFNPRFLDERRVEFMCHCNLEKVRAMLAMLPVQDLQEMMTNGPFPVEIRCHNCNSPYQFNQESLREIYGMRFPRN